MSLLLAFEAAARHESYTRAAHELSLTQSAVSRQVQILEKMLGMRLFSREGRQVVLTDVGRMYQRELCRGARADPQRHLAGDGVWFRHSQFAPGDAADFRLEMVVAAPEGFLHRPSRA